MGLDEELEHPSIEGKDWRAVPIELIERVQAALSAGQEPVERFIVKHYSSEERPIIKGNGFDGLEIGCDREEAEDFVKWLNCRLASAPPSGYVAVPVGVTDSMRDAAEKWMQTRPHIYIQELWDAMLAASRPQS